YSCAICACVLANSEYPIALEAKSTLRVDQLTIWPMNSACCSSSFSPALTLISAIWRVVSIRFSPMRLSASVYCCALRAMIDLLCVVRLLHCNNIGTPEAGQADRKIILRAGGERNFFLAR